MKKKFKKTEIKDILINWQEASGCMATDRITVDGVKVGYMYREKPDDDTEFGKLDSGWRFFAGDESDEYINNPDNIEIYALNTICNYDEDIIPFLNAPYGTAYFRNETGSFQEEVFEPINE